MAAELAFQSEPGRQAPCPLVLSKAVYSPTAQHPGEWRSTPSFSTGTPRGSHESSWRHMTYELWFVTGSLWGRATGVPSHRPSDYLRCRCSGYTQVIITCYLGSLESHHTHIYISIRVSRIFPEIIRTQPQALSFLSSLPLFHYFHFSFSSFLSS